MMATAATKCAQSAIAIDVAVESVLWSAHAGADDVVRHAIEAAAAFEGKVGEIAVLLTDDATIRAMNAQWRGIDKPTNVLSFRPGEATWVRIARISAISPSPAKPLRAKQWPRTRLFSTISRICRFTAIFI